MIRKYVLRKYYHFNGMNVHVVDHVSDEPFHNDI